MLQGIHLEVQGVTTAQQLHIHQESMARTWHLLPAAGLSFWGMRQIEFGQNYYMDIRLIALYHTLTELVYSKQLDPISFGYTESPK